MTTSDVSMTVAELDALGVATDIPTAARALGISTGQAYKHAKRGDFPCRVVKIGGRYSVPTDSLREALGSTTTTDDADLRRELDQVTRERNELRDTLDRIRRLTA